MIDKELFKRILAYIIDSTVVLLLTTLITNTKYLNPTYDTALERSNELQALSTSDIKIEHYLPFYHKDSEISIGEYDDLIKDNEYFGYLVVDAYSDNVITEEEYNYIMAETKKIYNDKAPQLYMDTLKANWYSYLVYLVVYFFYFVIFNMITKGITLGKKITGLQIVGLDNKEVTWEKYLLRSLIAYGYFIYLLELIVPYIIPLKYLMSVVMGLSVIMNALQIIVSVSVISNEDNRGLHDILAKTKVIDIRESFQDRLDNIRIVNEEKSKELNDINKDINKEKETIEEVVKPEVIGKNKKKPEKKNTVEAKTTEIELENTEIKENSEKKIKINKNKEEK